MLFDTNKKVAVLFIVAGVIVSYTLLREDNSKKMDAPKKEAQKSEVKKDKDISILYIDKGNENSNKNTQTAPQAQEQKVIVREEVDELATFYDDSERVKQYIKEKHLVNLAENSSIEQEQTKSRYSVYADISQKDASQNRDKTLPPMAPTIINGVFPSGSSYTVVVDSSVKQQARKIIVTDNNPDGTIQEAVQIPQTTSSDTQEITLTAPPSIGQ